MRLSPLFTRSTLLFCLYACFLTSAFAQVITTYAGTNWIFPGNGPALSAPLGSLQGVTLDPSGNIYITDASNDIVARVSPDGQLTVIAGNGVSGFSGDGGPALNASLNAPTGIARDSDGNIYFCENANFRIRQVSPDGTIQTIAGNGRRGFAGDNGPAVSARIDNVHGIVVAPDGSIFFSDWGNNRVRRINRNGIISTYVGTGDSTFGGDGGLAQNATLLHPNGLSLDAAGNLFIADQNHGRVRKVSPQGIINTIGEVAGCPTGVAADGAGGVYVADPCRRLILRFKADNSVERIGGNGSGQNEPSGDGGPALQASFDAWALALAPGGTLWISGPDYGRLYRISPSRIFSIVAGDGSYLATREGTPALQSFLLQPHGVTTDSAGNLYIADYGRNRIRKVAPNGGMTTLAGNGRNGFAGDGGPAVSSILWSPTRIRLDSSGNLFFTDLNNHRVRRIDRSGTITTVAGNGVAGYSGEGGRATSTRLNGPVGLAFDPSGNLYIADGDNHRVRKVAADGTVVTVAGTGQPGYSADNGPATAAMLNHPSNVDFDRAGNLYIADDRNHRIRKVTPDGTITTFAGNGIGGAAGDNGPATSARLNFPTDLFMAGDGSLYIADTNNARIRRVAPNGVISTVAGNGSAGFSGDGGPATSASLAAPRGVTVDSTGNLYIGDADNSRVRAVLTAAVSFQASPAELSFSAAAGGTPPAGQSVSLSSNVAGLGFSASTSQPWLTVSPSSGTIPTGFQVNADPAGLAAGAYSGTITVTSQSATPPSVRIPVAFTVQSGPTQPRLSLDSQSLTFSALPGTGAQTGQVRVLNSGGGTLSFTAVAATTSGGPWLSVSPPSGTATAFTPATLSLTANLAKLGAGTYSGSIAITGAGATATVAVTLSITAPDRVILVSQTGLTFIAVAAGGTPLPQTFGILNTGQGSMSWTASAASLSGGDWLRISPASGTVQRPYLDVSMVNVSINSAALSPGDYFGRIQVTAAAANSPQILTIILRVLPPGSSPGMEVRPTGLIFTGVAGVTPGSQDVFVGNPKGQPDAYLSGRIGKGFSYLPTNVSVPPNQPVTLRVFPDYTDVTPETVEKGTITLQFANDEPRTITVLNVIAPAAAGGAQGVRIGMDGSGIATAASSCAASTLLIQFRSPPQNGQSNFAAIAGQATTVEVQVTDRCGNLLGQGLSTGEAQAVASFSNGDTAINLTHIGNGVWTGTWRPVQPKQGPVSLTVTAVQLSAKQSGIAQITGTLASGTTPTVTASGVVHAASALVLPVAPGGLISIYGANLAEGTSQANSLPLPEKLAGTEVLMGDQRLPLLFSSSGQVNVQVPYTVPVNTQFQVSVQRGNALSVPEALSVAAAEPGIFTKNQQGTGQGIILKSDQVTLAQPGTPASVGEAIVIYCTGLGAVSPAVAAGTPAPSSPLSSITNPVTVIIGGKDAQTVFAGLTPGFAGLYQINAVVPAGIVPGDTVPVQLQVAGQTSPSVTMAVK